jgi:hypothetical protein
LIKYPLSAAAALLLDGWAGNRTEGTKHAAIAGLGPKEGFAVSAFIKILAGIGGHGLLALPAATGAGNNGLQ